MPHSAPKRSVPTAERILDAAEARFAARGYGATSLADVADDVAIRTPSLYKHFASKRDLYVAVVSRLLEPFVAMLGTLLAVPEDPEAAERNLTAVLTHYVRTPNLARLVQHAALAGGEELAMLVEPWYEPLFLRATELSRTGERQGREDALALVVAFHSMLSGYVTMAPLHAALTGRDPLAPEAIERLLPLVRRMAREAFLDAVPRPPEPTDTSKSRKKARRTHA